MTSNFKSPLVGSTQVFTGAVVVVLKKINNMELDELPSRRYTCKVCGSKGRRNNNPDQRKREPICPACIKNKEDKVYLFRESNRLLAEALKKSMMWVYSCRIENKNREEMIRLAEDLLPELKELVN
jgi:hypothetical protein